MTSGPMTPGRCEAYQLARTATADGIGGEFLVRVLGSCESQDRGLIGDLRSGVPPRGFYGWSLAPEHRRETMRVYASAMDPQVHMTACEVAATMTEARNIPECSVR